MDTLIYEVSFFIPDGTSMQAKILAICLIFFGLLGGGAASGYGFKRLLDGDERPHNFIYWIGGLILGPFIFATGVGWLASLI